MNDTNKSSTAYEVIYKFIRNGFGIRTGGWEFKLLPCLWYILSIPLEAGLGISAETCELDDVFPPDTLYVQSK